MTRVRPNEMQLFYLNLPWNIDENDYNCSGRTYSDWQSRGSVNYLQGTFFALSGITFTVFYIICLIGMARGGLLVIPCYRLMFFSGLLDILDLGVGSLVPAYFHFIGAVFCSTRIQNWIAGHLSWSFWNGASFSCVVLAINRVVEMIPALRSLQFLFRGKVLYMWMVIAVVYMVIRPFITRPTTFNSAVSAYILTPIITDDPEWEASHYALLFLPIHNISVLILMFIMYTILCCYVLRLKRTANVKLERKQYELFIQILLICATTIMAGSLYVYLEFFPASRALIITANVLWVLSHGLHAAVYIIFNRQIRKQVFQLFKIGNGRGALVGTRTTSNANELYGKY